MIELLRQLDTNILMFIHDNIQNAVFDKVMPVITFLGDKGLIWIIISLALLISKKYRKVGIMAFGALALSTILGEGLLKHLIHRERPFVDIPTIHLIISKPLSFSFPSGHTISSFAVAGVLAKMIKKYSVPVFVLAFLIAFSRLYLFVHYPSDVFAGIILGLACSKIILSLPMDRIYNMVHEKHLLERKGDL